MDGDGLRDTSSLTIPPNLVETRLINMVLRTSRDVGKKKARLPHGELLVLLVLGVGSSPL